MIMVANTYISGARLGISCSMLPWTSQQSHNVGIMLVWWWVKMPDLLLIVEECNESYESVWLVMAFLTGFSEN